MEGCGLHIEAVVGEEAKSDGMVEVAIVLLEELLDALAGEGDLVEGGVDVVEDDDDVGVGVDLVGVDVGEIVPRKTRSLEGWPLSRTVKSCCWRLGTGLLDLVTRTSRTMGCLAGAAEVAGCWARDARGRDRRKTRGRREKGFFMGRGS